MRNIHEIIAFRAAVLDGSVGEKAREHAIVSADFKTPNELLNRATRDNLPNLSNPRLCVRKFDLSD